MTPAVEGAGATALVPSNDGEEPDTTNNHRGNSNELAGSPPNSIVGTVLGAASSSPSMKRKEIDINTSEPIVPLKVPRRAETPRRALGQRHRHIRPPPQPPYRLDFGQHMGKSLNEVPPSWLLWAIDKGVHQQRLDLGIALYELGRTATLEHKGEILKAEPYSHAMFKQADNGSSTSEWVVPKKDHATAYHFWARKLDAPAWIADQDAINWFQVNPSEMEKVGICPLSAADVEEVSAPSGTVWWLYEVYRYAEHFCTTIHQTARQMLDYFLEKNMCQDSDIRETPFGV